MDNNLNWNFIYFSDLTVAQLYSILKLRQKVFIVEQNCPYLDSDDIDLKCYHLMGTDNNGNLVAYTRIIPSELKYTEVSIGRVVTDPSSRRKGYGVTLMKESLKQVEKLYGNIPIRIGAQKYLKKFYESFSFNQTGEPYLEDGIEHIEMLKQP